MKSCDLQVVKLRAERARGTLTFAQNLLGQLVAVLDGRMRLFVALFCPREKPRRWVRAQL